MTELSSQITDHTDPNEARVRYSPLDVSRLIKGQIIQVAELEPIIGLTYPDPRWSLRVLQLRSKIEVQRDRKGLSVLTMRYHAGTLVICDDSEAATYNHSMGKRSLRRFRRATIRNIAVDISKLTLAQQDEHLRTLRRQAMLVGAIRHAQYAKPLELECPKERTTPPMLTAE